MAFALKELYNRFGEIVDLEKATGVYGLVGQTMSLEGWILIMFNDEKVIVARYNSGIFQDEGYLLSRETVLMTCQNDINLAQITRDITNSESGSRFNGQLIDGIPYGEGILYDSNGTVIYSGTVIKWKREGYGVSYHANGTLEYAGTWCNDIRYGYGHLYSNNGQLVYSGEWVNGMKVDWEYCGDGRNLHTCVKTIFLSDNCIFTKFSVECFPLLEEIEIGEGTFAEAPCFKISNMNNLRSIKIHNQAFTNDSVETSPDRSFSITDCPNLKFIDISSNCFGDFGGDFVLANLPRLEKLLIGQTGSASINFASCSFVVRSRNPHLQ